MNTYNPNLHHRRSIRLKGYDYAQAGLYFITICCQDRVCRFGDVVNGEMILNEYGQIAHDEWMKLSERFPNFELDVFQIMPNHLHGLLFLSVGAPLADSLPSVGAPLAGALSSAGAQNPDEIRAGASPAPTVGEIVGAYKSLVANGCLSIYKSKNEIMGKLWQRNYYEHIIRNEQSYKRISEYITNNPVKWADDTFYQR